MLYTNIFYYFNFFQDLTHVKLDYSLDFDEVVYTEFGKTKIGKTKIVKQKSVQF